MSNYRVVRTKWDKVQRANVCENCNNKPRTVYIATSHDHTDEFVTLCVCGFGKSFQEIWPIITKGIFPTHSMEDYKEYFLTTEFKGDSKVSEQTNTVPSISEYQWNAMVLQLAKPGADIQASLTADKVDLMHAVMGIAGEAGELLDAIKKLVIYNKPLGEKELENIIEELGDLEFYMQQLRNNKLVLTTRLATLAANYHKLANKKTGRYASGSYSDKQAQDRLDKAEEATEHTNLVDYAIRVEGASGLNLHFLDLLNDKKLLAIVNNIVEYPPEVRMRAEKLIQEHSNLRPDARHLLGSSHLVDKFNCTDNEIERSCILKELEKRGAKITLRWSDAQDEFIITNITFA